MKNIHILPTDKSSRISIKDSVLILHRLQYRKDTQYIYITSDEEIKVGDWVYSLREGLEPILKQKVNTIGVNNDEMMKKIILTTDQDLIKDGVQAIDDEFLEWFVKHPSCEWVETEKWLNDDGGVIYSRIIPKEEPKQETLEEASIRAVKSGLFKDETLFNAGAKWQQEQILDFLYSEITERRDYSASKMCEKVIEFIEQFKNK